MKGVGLLEKLPSNTSREYSLLLQTYVQTLGFLCRAFFLSAGLSFAVVCQYSGSYMKPFLNSGVYGKEAGKPEDLNTGQGVNVAEETIFASKPPFNTSNLKTKPSGAKGKGPLNGRLVSFAWIASHSGFIES